MTRNSIRRCTNPDLSGTEATSNKLHYALQVLFELLEEYGPLWYQKQHHDLAKSALRLPVTPKRTSTAGGVPTSHWVHALPGKRNRQTKD
jgi:hypothetical protein